MRHGLVVTAIGDKGLSQSLPGLGRVGLQGENPLILPTVDYQAVASVVGDWTGIPVGRMARNEIETILNIGKLLGERVGLQAGSVTSASGDAQGGTVLVGGGYQGHGEVQNSSYTQADRGSVVDVSAGAQGKAGTAVLWSDGVTRAAGTIKATGGLSGGQVEVSGKKLLNIKGLDLRNSKGGNLLLDPGDVTICYLCTSTVTDDGFGTYTSPGAATTFLDIQDLDGYLSGNSSVTITTTTGAVAFNFAATWSLPGSSSSMTVNAGAGISFSNGVNISSSSPFNITLNAGTAGDRKRVV